MDIFIDYERVFIFESDLWTLYDDKSLSIKYFSNYKRLLGKKTIILRRIFIFPLKKKEKKK